MNKTCIMTNIGGISVHLKEKKKRERGKGREGKGRKGRIKGRERKRGKGWEVSGGKKQEEKVG